MASTPTVALPRTRLRRQGRSIPLHRNSHRVDDGVHETFIWDGDAATGSAGSGMKRSNSVGISSGRLHQAEA
jgi:hypothetical protein